MHLHSCLPPIRISFQGPESLPGVVLVFVPLHEASLHWDMRTVPDRRPPTNRILRRYIRGVRTCAPARPPTHCARSCLSLRPSAGSGGGGDPRPERSSCLLAIWVCSPVAPALASRFATALSKLLHRVVAARRRSFTDQSCIGFSNISGARLHYITACIEGLRPIHVRLASD